MNEENMTERKKTYPTFRRTLTREKLKKIARERINLPKEIRNGNFKIEAIKTSHYLLKASSNYCNPRGFTPAYKVSRFTTNDYQ
jgi:hypothetical protein